MANIVLTRIDNRLIHGQVATQWCSSVGANLILVANDDVSENSVQKMMMDMAIPSYATARYWSIKKTINTIEKANPTQKIFLVCETPQDVLKLIQGGINIKHINVGNMHMAEGKTQITKAISVDDDDIEVFKKILELGVVLEAQRVPSEKKELISDLIKKI